MKPSPTAARKKARQRYADVPLTTKMAPSQPRSLDTFELILDTTTVLLEEVGFERLSTNMICERAGVTPPALYRYFPNKYAVLMELGRRLMAVQDQEVFEWRQANPWREGMPLEEVIDWYRDVQSRVNAVSKRQRGAVWIMRALRAIPLLHAVRAESRESVAEQSLAAHRHRFPGIDDASLLTAIRVIIETMYAGTEMVLEDPDLDEALVNDYLARMVALFYATLGDSPRGPLLLPPRGT